MVDFPTPVEPLTPDADPEDVQRAATRSSAATWPRRCATRTRDLAPPPPGRRPARRGRSRRADDAEIARLRPALRAHPCHGCADREDHARWAERCHSCDRETDTLRRRVEQRTNTIARHVRPGLRGARRARLPRRRHGDAGPAGPAVADLHRARPGGGRVPAHGRLGRASTAAGSPPRLSALVYESRRPDDADAAAAAAAAASREALAETVRALGASCDALEREHRLDFLREPDLGFAWAAYRWAAGARSTRCCDDADLRRRATSCGGSSSCIDLPGQVADAAGRHRRPRAPRGRPCESLRRGVVAYSPVDTTRASARGQSTRRFWPSAAIDPVDRAAEAPGLLACAASSSRARRAAARGVVPAGGRGRAPPATTVGATSR